MQGLLFFLRSRLFRLSSLVSRGSFAFSCRGMRCGSWWQRSLPSPYGGDCHLRSSASSFADSKLIAQMNTSHNDARRDLKELASLGRRFEFVVHGLCNVDGES
jgi:hypothetical protein